ncbi:MAG: radical SAM family heme chaperone HemW [Candidatus Izemoplasmatales bacterium]
MIKGLYIHIPFCENICHYCDFVKYKASESLQITYMEALIKELASIKEDLSNVRTVYIGGGTPSHIHHDNLEQLLIQIQNMVDVSSLIEYSMEANPSDIDESLIRLLQKYHVSRLSIGVQSFSNRLLKLIGRTHLKDDVIRSVKLLNQMNFHNYNLDLIYAIPSQTLEDVKVDVLNIAQLNPTHISYYSLILEERTRLYYDVIHHHLRLVDEDLEMDMATYIEDTLTEKGYKQYEFSNYAKESYESNHNLLYWNLDDYLGVGLGASSLVDGARFSNVRHLKDYLENIKSMSHGGRIKEDTDLPYEYLLMGLRKNQGISMTKYNSLFNENILDAFPAIQKYVQLGFLEVENDYLRFTKKGKFLSNQFYMELR